MRSDVLGGIAKLCALHLGEFNAATIKSTFALTPRGVALGEILISGGPMYIAKSSSYNNTVALLLGLFSD